MTQEIKFSPTQEDLLEELRATLSLLAIAKNPQTETDMAIAADIEMQIYRRREVVDLARAFLAIENAKGPQS